MYINFVVAKELYDLSPQELMYLIIIKQSVSDPLSLSFLEDLHADVSKVLMYIDLNKKGQKRLNKAGVELLENLKAVKATKEDTVIADYLAKEYESLGKKVGNKKQLVENITLFRKHASISAKGVFILIQEFLKDDIAVEYSQRADYLISKPQRFDGKFDINGSMLYQFYLRRKEKIDSITESLEQQQQ